MPANDAVPCFYLEQDDTWEKPAVVLTRAEVRDLKTQKIGRFENHGRTFRFFQSSPVVVRRVEDEAIYESGTSTEAAISFTEMQANVGIVEDHVRNPRGFVAAAQAKVAWYPHVRTHPELASGRWSQLA